MSSLFFFVSCEGFDEVIQEIPLFWRELCKTSDKIFLEICCAITQKARTKLYNFILAGPRVEHFSDPGPEPNRIHPINAADVLNAIRETKDLSTETEALLNKAITTRVAEFLQNQ